MHLGEAYIEVAYQIIVKNIEAVSSTFGTQALGFICGSFNVLANLSKPVFSPVKRRYTYFLSHMSVLRNKAVTLQTSHRAPGRGRKEC